MALMTIGEFAARTRLSAKALRLYDELRLVVPAEVDPRSGYRLYREDQVERARLVGQLRRLGMPLAMISTTVTMDGATAARALTEWWAQVEAATGQRRALVSYLISRLLGEDSIMFDINTRRVPQRRLVAVNRHAYMAETEGFFADAFARLRAAGPGIDGIAGVPFVVFYGEVSDDSDGPIELCRPVAMDLCVETAGDVQTRVEPAHDEAYIRVAMKDMGWPALLPAGDALDRWVDEHRRRPAGPLRQVLIADQRTAGPETPVCDLSVPLR